jgi:hypothetical protein
MPPAAGAGGVTRGPLLWRVEHGLGAEGVEEVDAIALAVGNLAATGNFAAAEALFLGEAGAERRLGGVARGPLVHAEEVGVVGYGVAREKVADLVVGDP